MLAHDLSGFWVSHIWHEAAPRACHGFLVRPPAACVAAAESWRLGGYPASHCSYSLRILLRSVIGSLRHLRICESTQKCLPSDTCHPHGTQIIPCVGGGFFKVALRLAITLNPDDARRIENHSLKSSPAQVFQWKHAWWLAFVSRPQTEYGYHVAAAREGIMVA